MSSPIVEQLTNGIRVRAADGTEIPCAPLPLGVGMQISDQWDERARAQQKLRQIRTQLDAEGDPARKATLELELGEAAQVGARARIAVVKTFLKQYPQLAGQVSAGDVELLLPDFFWSTTGAEVVIATETPDSPSIGTPPGAPTSPPGVLSQTP